MAEKKFSLSTTDDYVHLKTWGKLDVKDVDAPATAAIALAKEKGLHKLLDDIREVDSSQIDMYVQAKGIGVLWKLTSFKKVAIIVNSDELGSIFLSTLGVLHLKTTFKDFDNEVDAIAWLKAE